jgi:hypothetical protein
MPPPAMDNGDADTDACKRESMTDRYLQQVAAIRSLNDELRTSFRGGKILISDEMRELGPTVVAHALLTMTETTSFADREHRAGRFVFCGRVFRWCISYGAANAPENARSTKRELHLWL